MKDGYLPNEEQVEESGQSFIRQIRNVARPNSGKVSQVDGRRREAMSARDVYLLLVVLRSPLQVQAEIGDRKAKGGKAGLEFGGGFSQDEHLY